MLNDFRIIFKRSFKRALKYGYFAPLTALWLAFKRPGGYLRHLLALYRLCFWKGSMYS